MDCRKGNFVQTKWGCKSIQMLTMQGQLWMGDQLLYICTFPGWNLVTWKSKNQNVVARFSAEVEFRVMV